MAALEAGQFAFTFHEGDGFVVGHVVVAHEIAGDEGGRAATPFGAMDEDGAAGIDLFFDKFDPFFNDMGGRGEGIVDFELDMVDIILGVMFKIVDTFSPDIDNGV